MIKVIGPNNPTPTDGIVINTTSRSDNWSKGLSPKMGHGFVLAMLLEGELE